MAVRAAHDLPGTSARLNYRSLMPLNRKAGNRRLVDMNEPAEPERPWIPYLPADDSIEQPLPLGERSRCIQRLAFDEQGRLVEWAVIQSRLVDGQWQRVAVYDTCHDKGVHVHLFNRQEERFTEISLRRPIKSYKDVEDGLDYVMHCLIDLGYWQENERRSDCGR
jgi:hypothetical protein